jgi:hypothetical protein
VAARRPPVFWIGTVVLVGLCVFFAVLVFTGGGDDGGPGAGDVLRIDLVEDAIAAVLAEQGDDVAFYEVNATPDLVNVFVQGPELAGSTTAIAYVFDDDGLAAPGEPTAASGPTFTADLVGFEPDEMLDAVLAELPTSIPRVFSVIATPGSEGAAEAVEYRVTMESVSGGSLSVSVRPDGTIIGVDAE